MSYLNFKSEYLRLCEKFGRDTSRKIANDLRKDIIELEYRINAIEPVLRLKPFTYLYGEKCTLSTLEVMQTELEFTKQLLHETKN